MDQYVSWGLHTDQLTLEFICGKFEDFCKPQSNEVHARFDLLTSFCQGNRSIDEWYNVVQAWVNLAKYPPETAKILQRDIFWFFLCDEEFVSKTISDGSVDLEKFPASKVRQLAKKLESSKATSMSYQTSSRRPASCPNQSLETPAHRDASWEIQEEKSTHEAQTIKQQESGPRGIPLTSTTQERGLIARGCTLINQDVPSVVILYT